MSSARMKWNMPVALLVILMMAACGSQDAPKNGAGKSQGQKGPQQARKRPEAKPMPIAVTRVEIGEATSVYTTTATLEAEHHAQILARTTGVAREILVEEGDVVEKDQVLLVIEDDDQQLRLKQAELKLAQVKAEHARQKKMLDAGILSEQEFEQTDNELETAAAELEVAQLALSYTRVRAPFSGNIVRRHLDLGAHVTNSMQLFEMMDISPLLARIHVPSNRMGKVSAAQTVNLFVDSTGVELAGDIRLVSPIVDPTSGTVKITAEIATYPQGTRPGDFVEAQIVTDLREGAMLVPSVAVFEEQGKQVLFVVEGDKAIRRTVKTGYIQAGVTEILEGIEKDDIIVIKGQRNLRDGMPVNVLEGADEALASSRKQGVGA